jgi:hypothetical protein
MSKSLVASQSGFFGSLANLRRLAFERDRRGVEGSPTRVLAKPATVDVRQHQPSSGASIIAAGLGHHAESLDAVAGSEFVDDRIRLRE